MERLPKGGAMTQSAQSVENTERIGVCESCGQELKTARWRGKRLCRECMIGDEIPCRLEDHMGYTGPLADESRLDEVVPFGILSWSSPFSQQLDKAMRKEGWLKSINDLKDEMFAGAKQKEG